jgi:hypothetical protein
LRNGSLSFTARETKHSSLSPFNRKDSLKDQLYYNYLVDQDQSFSQEGNKPKFHRIKGGRPPSKNLSFSKKNDLSFNKAAPKRSRSANIRPNNFYDEPQKYQPRMKEIVNEGPKGFFFKTATGRTVRAKKPSSKKLPDPKASKSLVISGRNLQDV